MTDYSSVKVPLFYTNVGVWQHVWIPFWSDVTVWKGRYWSTKPLQQTEWQTEHVRISGHKRTGPVPRAEDSQRDNSKGDNYSTSNPPFPQKHWTNISQLWDCAQNSSDYLLTVASGEHSFSMLKQIKNCLRASVSQDRLCGLAILSIEKAVASKMNYTDLTAEFAARKARKVTFT